MYIYLGVLPALEAYREKYLENNTFNELDFKFMEVFELKLKDLLELWKTKRIGLV